MDFILCVPTLNRFDACNAMIRSAYAGAKKPYATIVVDNSGGKYRVAEDLTKNTIDIYVAEQNIGVARSFNLLMYAVGTQYTNKYALISNDDLIFKPDTIEMFRQGITDNPSELLYATEGLGLNAFSLFAVMPRTFIEQVGFFEVDYFSYLEDLDAAFRLRLLGKDICKIKDCNVQEHIGSATIAEYTEEEMMKFHAMRSRGFEIFAKKWGCGDNVDYPTYTTPYNTGIDAVTWHHNKFRKIQAF